MDNPHTKPKPKTKHLFFLHFFYKQRQKKKKPRKLLNQDFPENYFFPFDLIVQIVQSDENSEKRE
jgi:hypothetical protein